MSPLIERLDRLRESWRFAVGTLTAIPVRPPRSDAGGATGPAMLLAPLAVAPLGVLVAAVCWAGHELGLAPVGTAAAAITALALGSRAFTSTDSRTPRTGSPLPMTGSDPWR